MTQSDLEATMDLHLRAAGITGYMREFKWHELRKWRADFAFVPQRVLLEVEGFGHHKLNRYYGDIEKYNEANIESWCLIRVTKKMIENGEAIKTLRRALSRGGESYRYESGGYVTEWEDV